ncbi:MAG TPA: uroporphyrinogen-III synthase [Pyrinomonadaceae bacterium]|nr:uroporphyrinogen-III synthase [Pyrinomonadaceae bacterium]
MDSPAITTDKKDLALTGKTIVITRAANQANDFVTALESLGARVLLCPTIEITEPESYDALDEALDHLYGYDWLIFTSANAVDYFLRRLEAKELEVSELDNLRVCAIGEATAEKLYDRHVHVDVVPEQSKAEGVFAALENYVGGREQLAGLNILIPRAAVARDYLPVALETAGARVDVVTAYRTVQPSGVDRGRVSAVLAGGGADCIAFTSGSTVRNLAGIFDTSDLSDLLRGVAVAVIGDVTAETAANFGLRVDIKPQETTIAALARAIADFFAKDSGARSLLNADC